VLRVIILKHGMKAITRTERDIPAPVILFSVLVLLVPMAIFYGYVVHNVGLGIFMAILLLFCGFLFSAVGAYMAGLVGSSNNPISGITLTTMIVSSALLLGFLGTQNPLGPPAAILIGAVVCCAAAIAGDNMQDLKAGYIVGNVQLEKK
jgi:putative OPT family oligopeptide transporter